MDKVQVRIEELPCGSEQGVVRVRVRYIIVGKCEKGCQRPGGSNMMLDESWPV